MLAVQIFIVAVSVALVAALFLAAWFMRRDYFWRDYSWLMAMYAAFSAVAIGISAIAAIRALA